MLPKTIDEEDLHNMFAPYGELREVHIIRGPEGSSKGCAFVKFVDRDAAMVAIEDMNELIPPVSTENVSLIQCKVVANFSHTMLHLFYLSPLLHLFPRAPRDLLSSNLPIARSNLNLKTK